MVQEVRLRFSPDGECRQLAVDFITVEIDKKQYEYDEIKAINTSTKTLRFLEKNSFQFVLYLHPLSLLSPITWYQLMYFRKNISINNNIDSLILKLKEQNITFGLLTHISPKKLYNLSNQNWTHCVGSIYKNKGFELFDPLYNLLKSEYGGIISSPTEETITKKSYSKILIWKKDK